MRYCKKCLQPDTRPGIKFDDNSICYACLYDESTKKINWAEREQELNNIAKWAKKTATGVYNCVVGVSGGKDSTFQAIYVKEKLGLNPLLVNCEPDEITELGRHNIDNLSNLGFDIIKIKPNPIITKKLVKRSFYEYGNILKPTEYSLIASAFIVSDKFDIPLIVQGESDALALGVMDFSIGTDGDALNMNNCQTLAGCNASDWFDDELGAEQLFFYQFPNKTVMLSKGIKAIYLQYYAKEWSQNHNADFALARGFRGREKENLHDLGRYKRNTGVDSDLAIVNQMIKYYKFGFGFATDEACYDIRDGLLTREQAIALVREYDGKCGEKYINDFCRYINIATEEFWNVVDKFVNKKLFEKDKNGKWQPKFIVGEDFLE